MAAPEIRKGDFVYRDTLFVEVGEGKRHPRAAPSELRALLMPRTSSTVVKDQVAHWYEAQLIHYGLTRSRDKNVAKVRLIAALSTDGLKLPSEIQRKEGEMKKEYAAALRKLKATEKKGTDSAPNLFNGKKRKADDGGSTRISLNVDGVELTIDRKSGSVKEHSSKKAKNESGEKTKATPKPKTAKIHTPIPAYSQSSGMRKSVTSKAIPKQTARRSRAHSQYPSTSFRPTAAPRPIADHTPRSFRHSYDDEDDSAPPAYDSIDFSRDERSSSPVQISGSYAVDTDQSTSELTLRIDQSKQELWGRFEIGSTKGVLFMDNIDEMLDKNTVTFAWRAEDTFNDRYYFRRDQAGWLQIDGRGSIHGCFSGLMSGDDVDFDGQLVSDEAPNVTSFRFEWDKIPRMAYGRINS